MISYIEAPRYDEPLFGFLSRLVDRIPITSRCGFARYVFGRPRGLAHMDFPYGLDAIAASIGHRVGLDAERLMWGHTMLPLVAPLLEPRRADAVIKAMCGCDDNQSHRVHGFRDHAIVGKRRLRFCLRCRSKDIDRYGDSWWRRLYQVPGVVCCPICGDSLFTSQFVFGKNWKVDYPSADQAEPFEQGMPSDNIDLAYAREIQWLLDHRTPYFDPNKLKQLYHCLLASRGLTTRNRLQRSAFLMEFATQRPAKEWAARGLEFDSSDRNAWPAQTVKARLNHNNIRLHLAVMTFLGITIREAAEKLSQMKENLETLDETNENIAPRLKRWWDDRSVKIEDMCDELCISRGRLLGIADEVGLQVPRHLDRNAKARFLGKVRMYRQLYSEGLNKLQPGRRRTTLNWLRRNQPSWLRNKGFDGKLRSNRRQLVDWEKRQDDLIPQLPYLAARIRAAHPFRRVGITTLLDMLPYGLLSTTGTKYLSRLIDKVRQLEESPREFLLRKIRTIRQTNPAAAPWELRDLASVPRKCFDPEILSTMGYELVGGKWVIPGAVDHPNYGIVPITGNPSRRSRRKSSINQPG